MTFEMRSTGYFTEPVHSSVRHSLKILVLYLLKIRDMRYLAEEGPVAQTQSCDQPSNMSPNKATVRPTISKKSTRTILLDGKPVFWDLEQHPLKLNHCITEQHVVLGKIQGLD